MKEPITTYNYCRWQIENHLKEQYQKRKYNEDILEITNKNISELEELAEEYNVDYRKIEKEVEK